MGASLLTLERMRQGYTQKQVAIAAGINRNVMSGIECRRVVANEAKRRAIMEVIGGNESDFFDRQTGLAK
ncbi:MAG: XRE family transcriptional regulator [Synergistales bacterium]|nr:XRE family transcriptional regulator [Synergistales bacterium]